MEKILVKKMTLPENSLQTLKEYITRIKNLKPKESNLLASLIREYLVDVVENNGGHLSSNLGIVELTIALYQSFHFPRDSLVFDVSHQAYVHKILSDRLYEFRSLRTKNGISGFTEYKESPYDISHVGHAGTAISTGLGFHKAKIHLNDHSFTIVIVGDASMANGTSFEALNHIHDIEAQKFIIILNDNQMSISKAVGAFSKLLTGIMSNPFYNRSRKRVKKFLKIFGETPNRIIGSMLVRIKNLVFNNYFENFGVRYIGPIDGHNIIEMKSLFENIINRKAKIDKPLLLHILTTKGKGYSSSEASPEATHGIGPKTYKKQSIHSSYPTYSQILEAELPILQKKYTNITATTAAMTGGTGLKKFSEQYPSHFFDVGIAESHAVAFSSSLNYKKSYKPYIAIYSTFFQRAMDQVFQDVCLQELAPVFILDRAGLVGEDGATHHGIYDIAYLKAFPKLILCSPSSQDEFKLLLEWSYHQNSPVVIRIPKAQAPPHPVPLFPIQIGRGYWLEKTPQAQFTIMSYGPIIQELLIIKEQLPPMNIVNMLFAKPLDVSLIKAAVEIKQPIITLEEHSLIGGIGESIRSEIAGMSNTVPVFSLGIPDQFIQHATREEQLEEVSLRGETLKHSILNFLNLINNF